MCTIYGIDDESFGHALYSFPVAQDVWSQACLKIQKTSFSDYLFAKIWISLTGKLSPFELGEAAFISKLIWDRRNEVVYLMPITSPNALIQKARFDISIIGGTPLDR